MGACREVKTLFTSCYWGGGRDRGSTFVVVLNKDGRVSLELNVGYTCWSGFDSFSYFFGGWLVWF